MEPVCSNSPSRKIHLEGFLVKRGHVRHNWKTRWFRLSESSLRYYKNKKHKVPHGRIALSNAKLDKTHALSEAERDSRANVFKVTTQDGLGYPIQASTASEFRIWTNTIQSVIDGLNVNIKSHETASSNGNNSDQVEENKALLQKAEEFLKIGSRLDGAPCEVRTFDGIRYTQGFSGLELQRWIWRNMGITAAEGDGMIAEFIRMGVLKSLTPTMRSRFSNKHYYILTITEDSLKAGSAAFMNGDKTKTANSSTTAKITKEEEYKQSYAIDKAGLPGDLPLGKVFKRGILFKRGHIVPSWKARCFVLQQSPSTLSYFDPTKKVPKTLNTLSLNSATVFTVTKTAAEAALNIHHPPDHLFCVKVSSGEIYLMIAASDEERDDWMESIKSLCGRHAL